MSAEASDLVLLAGIPRRHLSSVVETCAANGRVILPAGRPGDLDRVEAGAEVRLMIVGEDEVPAATWRASFVRRVDPQDDLAGLVPSSWLEERRAAPASDEGEDDDEDDEEENEGSGTQSYFEVERLEELPKQDWVFANEVVRKQERGGRSFLPRGPRLIRLPV